MRLIHLAGVAATLIGTVALPSSYATATPIAAFSQIDFSGGVNPVGAVNTYDPSLTGLDFRTSGLGGPAPGSVSIGNSSTGSFAVFNAFTCPSAATGGCGTIIDLQSLTVVPPALTVPPLPISDFVTFLQGGYLATFDLSLFSITQAQPIGVQTLGTMTMSGAGMLNFTGYDATPAIFTLTSQGPGNTTFSGTVVANPTDIPEPMSMLILGIGAVGLALVRRRRAVPAAA